MTYVRIGDYSSRKHFNLNNATPFHARTVYVVCTDRNVQNAFFDPREYIFLDSIPLGRSLICVLGNFHVLMGNKNTMICRVFK